LPHRVFFFIPLQPNSEAENKMKYSEIERKLKEAGCCCTNDSGKHPKWYSPITCNTFSLSHHKSEEAKIGTKQQISKLSGVRL